MAWFAPARLCSSTLADALGTGELRLAAGCALGLLAIAGWGMSVEALLRRRTSGPSLAHAFVEGTVVVSTLRLAFSLIGVANASWPIALAGIALLPVATIRAGLRLPDRRELAWAAAIAILVLPACAYLVSAPATFSDLTAIWGLHAKALTCEPLLRSHYVTEPVWAGTHPDYPLYLPFLHSFFFTLQDSFRDDWVKVWQAATWLATLVAVRRSLSSALGPLRALAAVVALAAVTAIAPERAGLRDGFVELHVVCFTALIAASLYSGDRARLPLYLFGLATTKHEALAIAAAFLALHAFSELARSGSRREELRKELAYALPSLALILAWLLVLRQLPSRHENYPARLLDGAAWARGFSTRAIILAGWRATVLQWPWPLAFGLAPIAAAAAAVAIGRGREVRIARASLVCLATFAAGLIAFFASYLVTPWGPNLFQNTLDRLFSQAFPLAVIGVVGATSIFEGVARRWAGWATLAVFVLGYALPAASRERTYLKHVALRGQRGEWGMGAYLANPQWRAALFIDAHTQPAASGATLGMEYYFTWNYLLYPRLVYPQSKEVIAGTWRPWPRWNTPQEVPWQRLGLAYWISDAAFGRFPR
jgi:hypothetical protein